jgi:hypothetical protein
MTIKNVIIKDTVFVVSAFIIGTLLFLQPWFSAIQITLGILGVILVVGLVWFAGFIYMLFIKWLFYTWKHKIKLFFHIKKLLSHNYDTRMIDTVFTYFIHYYEMNASEIETTREFPVEDFPEGRFELVRVYQYIKEIRKHNLDLLNHLDYNNRKNCPVFHNMQFSSIRFKVRDFILFIEGHSSLEVFSYLQYSMCITKINNALYDLDTEVSAWIIKNRKHLGF